MTDGRGRRAAHGGRERRRALIERLNANDEYLRRLEGQRRATGQLSEEELAQEIERERNLSRLGFGQAGGGGLS